MLKFISKSNVFSIPSNNSTLQNVKLIQNGLTINNGNEFKDGEIENFSGVETMKNKTLIKATGFHNCDSFFTDKKEIPVVKNLSQYIRFENKKLKNPFMWKNVPYGSQPSLISSNFRNNPTKCFPTNYLCFNTKKSYGTIAGKNQPFLGKIDRMFQQRYTSDISGSKNRNHNLATKNNESQQMENKLDHTSEKYKTLSNEKSLKAKSQHEKKPEKISTMILSLTKSKQTNNEFDYQQFYDVPKKVVDADKKWVKNEEFRPTQTEHSTEPKDQLAKEGFKKTQTDHLNPKSEYVPTIAEEALQPFTGSKTSLEKDQLKESPTKHLNTKNESMSMKEIVELFSEPGNILEEKELEKTQTAHLKTENESVQTIVEKVVKPSIEPETLLKSEHLGETQSEHLNTKSEPITLLKKEQLGETPTEHLNTKKESMLTVAEEPPIEAESQLGKEGFVVRTIEYVPYQRKRVDTVPIKLPRRPNLTHAHSFEIKTKPIGLIAQLFGKKLKGSKVLRSFKNKLHTSTTALEPSLRLFPTGLLASITKPQFLTYTTKTNPLFKKEEKDVEDVQVESPYAISYDAESVEEEELPHEEEVMGEESEELEREEETIEEDQAETENEDGIAISDEAEDLEDVGVVNRDIEVSDEFHEADPNLVFDGRHHMPFYKSKALRNFWKKLDQCNNYTFQLNLFNVTGGARSFHTLSEKRFLTETEHILKQKRSSCSGDKKPPSECKASYRNGVYAEIPYILVCDQEYESQVAKRTGEDYKNPQYFLYHCYSFYDFFNYLMNARSTNPCDYP